MTSLDRYAQLEASMDDRLLAAVHEHTGTDFVFSNGWRYGAPIPPASVTLNDLHDIIPLHPPHAGGRVNGR